MAPVSHRRCILSEVYWQYVSLGQLQFAFHSWACGAAGLDSAEGVGGCNICFVMNKPYLLSGLHVATQLHLNKCYLLYNQQHLWRHVVIAIYL